MARTETLTVPIKAEFDATAAKVSWGPSSWLGLAAAIGAVIAAISGNDIATAVGGIAAIVTQAGRYSQATVVAREAARAALPWVKEFAELPDPPTR